MLRLTKAILSIMLSLSLNAATGIKYEGKLISYNNKNFKVLLSTENGEKIKPIKKAFPKEVLTDREGKNIHKLIGKEITFTVPLELLKKNP